MNLYGRHAIVHPGNFPAGITQAEKMSDRNIKKRILSIFFHKIPVKICLNLQMPQILFFHIQINVGMTFTVQHKMAEITIKICPQYRIRILLILFHTVFKKICGNTFVKFHSFLINTVLADREIVKQKILSVKAEKKGVFPFSDNLLFLLRKCFVYFLSKIIMCICCRHITSLLLQFLYFVICSITQFFLTAYDEV